MSVPYRRCFYIDERGEQCDSWFAAEELGRDTGKLCARHRDNLNINGRINEETKIKYIDLVNDERTYCYHFLSGIAQEQKQTLIHEFADDIEGTIFDKIDQHISFLEKVIEDTKARLHSARAVRTEKLDELSEEERKKLRAIKIDKAARNEEKKTKVPSFKSDPVAFLASKNRMSKSKARDLLSMDTDALLAKFAEAKKNKEKGE